MCFFHHFGRILPPPPPPKKKKEPCILCLGPLSDYYAIKPLLRSSERAAGSLSNLKKSWVFFPSFPWNYPATRAWVSNWHARPWRRPPPFFLMKSLGLNYTFQTLIVIDKTPVARTNDGRLAPLQAALQEEKERDFKLTMQSEGGKKRSIQFFLSMYLALNCLGRCST